MAGGANKKFLSDPKSFIKNRIIDVKVNSFNLQYVSARHVDPTKAPLAQQGRLATRGAHVAGPQRAAGVYEFDLFKAARKGSVRKSGLFGIRYNASVTVYELKEWGLKKRDQIDTLTPTGIITRTFQTPTRAHPIRAYWAPWSSNTCWSVQLGNQADFFFTPTMDGCSLAISSGASPVVSHGNFRNLADPTRTDQTRTVNEITAHHTALGVDVGRHLYKNTYVATPEEKTEGTNKLVTVIGIRDTSANTWRFYWQRRKVDANRPNAGPILQDRLVEL